MNQSPSLLRDLLAGLVLAVALYCAARLVTALAAKRHVAVDADVTHILMGVAMAGMFAPRLAFGPGWLWLAVFAAVAAWYLARIVRASRGTDDPWCGLRHHLGHLIAAGAMLFMAAMPANGPADAETGGSGGMDMGSAGSGPGASTLALAFVLLLIGYAVLVANRIPRTAAAAGSAGSAGAMIEAGDAGEAEAGAGAAVGTVGTVGNVAAAAVRGPLLAPRAAALCEVVMSVAMGVMLISML